MGRFGSSIGGRCRPGLERSSSLSCKFIGIRRSCTGCGRLSAIVVFWWVCVSIHRLVTDCWSVAHQRGIAVLDRRFLSQELGLSSGRVTLRSRRHIRRVRRLSWIVLLRPMLLLLESDSCHGQDRSSLVKDWSSSCVCCLISRRAIEYSVYWS